MSRSSRYVRTNNEVPEGSLPPPTGWSRIAWPEVDGTALCRMFNRAIRLRTLPKYLSSDHDPLYRFHQWQANLRVLGVTEIKTVPFVPLSHPFVERLIGTIRRECLDHLLFWTAADLELKLSGFQNYYNIVQQSPF